uniref:Putative secreted protein n=1 Tax=Anopheles darlingi TaxID=43151 RepID=A0A2M4D2Y9_ANODA
MVPAVVVVVPLVLLLSVVIPPGPAAPLAASEVNEDGGISEARDDTAATAPPTDTDDDDDVAVVTDVSIGVLLEPFNCASDALSADVATDVSESFALASPAFSFPDVAIRLSPAGAVGTETWTDCSVAFGDWNRPIFEPDIAVPLAVDITWLAGCCGGVPIGAIEVRILPPGEVIRVMVPAAEETGMAPEIPPAAPTEPAAVICDPPTEAAAA